MTAGRAKLEQALTECTLHTQVLGEAGAALPPAFSAAMVAVVATLPLSAPIAFVTAKPCFSPIFVGHQNLRHAVELTAVVTPAEEGGSIALNPETGTTTQGETVEDAVAKLQEATALYLKEFPMVSRGHAVVTTFSVHA